MITLRKLLSLGALSLWAALILTAFGSAPSAGKLGLNTALRLLLLPLAVTFAGILRERAWGRWLGLAGALAVLPWSVAYLSTEGPRPPMGRAWLAFAAAAVLLAGLSGRAMLKRFEGPEASRPLPPGPGRLVRWTLIGNIAAAIVLYVFVAAYEYQAAWRILIPGVLLGCLIVGVLLLGLGKTLGLLLVGAGCILFVPAGLYFVRAEAASAGEGVLFAVVMLPGVLMGWVTLLAFARPMGRLLLRK